MDGLLIRNSRHIRLANEHGQRKMLRNILALQQNLKTLGDEPLEVNFDRSRRFWDLFVQGPKVRSGRDLTCPERQTTDADHVGTQSMLDQARAGTIDYEFEDLKALLNLQCGVDQSGKDGRGAQPGATPLLGSDSTGPQNSAGDKARRQYNEYLIVSFPSSPTAYACAPADQLSGASSLPGLVLARSDWRNGRRVALPDLRTYGSGNVDNKHVEALYCGCEMRMATMRYTC